MAPCTPAQVNARLRELHTTLEAGERLREGVLQSIALSLEGWGLQVGAPCSLACIHVPGCLDGP